MNKAPCQRSHGLRFEPGTAANRTVFKAQGHTDRTKGARTKALTCWRQFYSWVKKVFNFIFQSSCMIFLISLRLFQRLLSKPMKILLQRSHAVIVTQSSDHLLIRLVLTVHTVVNLTLYAFLTSYLEAETDFDEERMGRKLQACMRHRLFHPFWCLSKLISKSTTTVWDVWNFIQAVF